LSEVSPIVQTERK